MVRIFVDHDAMADGRIRLRGDQARHLGGALRIRPGEELVAVTPDGVEHRCKVISATARDVEAVVLDSAPSRREPSLRIRIAQALLKGDQFDRILEYASELGVESVQPMLTERTVARPEAGKLAGRMDRWRQIVRQGAELGQRGRLPDVLPVATPEEAAAAATAAGFKVLLLYEGTGRSSLSEADLGADGVCVMTGPEGGWSEPEVELAEASGAAIVSLGPRIMRPLPAVLAAIGALYHRSGDLQLKED
jgi:16S rRNA (uracil1498-N3)-methyltransferase